MMYIEQLKKPGKETTVVIYCRSIGY